MVDVAQLTRIDDLRVAWPDEASDFTPWLAEHIQQLGQALGLDLEIVHQEAPVGAFALDLLATETVENRTVVIENQLERTNHDHLGKLLTYAAGYDASIVIWIAKELRDEHRQALDWLNQRTASETQFFGIVVELVRIDESRPAFHFDVVAKPNERRKEKSRSTPSERTEAYRSFFQGLIDELREKHQFTNLRPAQPNNCYSFPGGRSGIKCSAVFSQFGRARAEIYIDTDDKEENKRIFDGLKHQSDVIQGVIGEPLEWERLDDRRPSRIAIYKAGSIDDSEEELQALRAWFIAKLLLLRSQVMSYLLKLPPAAHR